MGKQTNCHLRLEHGSRNNDEPDSLAEKEVLHCLKYTHGGEQVYDEQKKSYEPH